MLETYNNRMAQKLGLKSADPVLTKQFMTLLMRSEADFTNAFRALAHIPTGSNSSSPGDSANCSSSSNSGSNNSGGQDHAAAASADPEKVLSSASDAVGVATAAGIPQQLAEAFDGAAVAAAPELIDEWLQWMRVWQGRLQEEGLPEAERQAMQKLASPKFIPRQHLLQV
jgi:uncharacterized protein YdiU (UPF0061 family)